VELLKKEKKVALEKYLRIPTVQFLFGYHVLLQRYFTGTEKSAFQAKLAKIGQFFVYNTVSLRSCFSVSGCLPGALHSI